MYELTSGSIEFGFISSSHIARKCILKTGYLRCDPSNGAIRIILQFGVKRDHVHKLVQIIKIINWFENQRFYMSADGGQALLRLQMIHHILLHTKPPNNYYFPIFIIADTYLNEKIYLPSRIIIKQPPCKRFIIEYESPPDIGQMKNSMPRFTHQRSVIPVLHGQLGKHIFQQKIRYLGPSRFFKIFLRFGDILLEF